MTKNWTVSLTITSMLLLMLVCAAPGWATGGHYPAGIEGAMGPSVPPPGFHYRQYNLYLDSDTITDDNGDELAVGFDLNVFAQVHRLIYITKHKFLGADYGFSMNLGIIGTDLNINAAGLHDSEVGFMDIFIEPLILAWHTDRWDAVLGLGINLPTGEFDQMEPASCGIGNTSGMLSLGATYYIDQAKSWTVSALSRTLVYGEQEDTDLTPGWEILVEWGIGKQFAVSKGLLIRPALCGNAYWQMDEDSGPGVIDEKGQNYGIGGEINFFWLPPHLYQVNLRVTQDFGSEDEVEATRMALTITKSF